MAVPSLVLNETSSVSDGARRPLVIATRGVTGIPSLAEYEAMLNPTVSSEKVKYFLTLLTAHHNTRKEWTLLTIIICNAHSGRSRTNDNFTLCCDPCQT